MTIVHYPSIKWPFMTPAHWLSVTGMDHPFLRITFSYGVMT